MTARLTVLVTCLAVAACGDDGQPPVEARPDMAARWRSFDDARRLTIARGCDAPNDPQTLERVIDYFDAFYAKPVNAAAPFDFACTDANNQFLAERSEKTRKRQQAELEELRERREEENSGTDAAIEARQQLFAELDDAAISLEEAIQSAQDGAGAAPIARARIALERLAASEYLGPLAGPADSLIGSAEDAEAAAATDDLRALANARQAAGDARLELAEALIP